MNGKPTTHLSSIPLLHVIATIPMAASGIAAADGKGMIYDNIETRTKS